MGNQSSAQDVDEQNYNQGKLSVNKVLPELEGSVNEVVNFAATLERDVARKKKQVQIAQQKNAEAIQKLEQSLKRAADVLARSRPVVPIPIPIPNPITNPLSLPLTLPPPPPPPRSSITLPAPLLQAGDLIDTFVDSAANIFTDAAQEIFPAPTLEATEPQQEEPYIPEAPEFFPTQQQQEEPYIPEAPEFFPTQQQQEEPYIPEAPEFFPTPQQQEEAYYIPEAPEFTPTPQQQRQAENKAEQEAEIPVAPPIDEPIFRIPPTVFLREKDKIVGVLDTASGEVRRTSNKRRLSSNNLPPNLPFSDIELARQKAALRKAPPISNKEILRLVDDAESCAVKNMYWDPVNKTCVGSVIEQPNEANCKANKKLYDPAAAACVDATFVNQIRLGKVPKLTNARQTTCAPGQILRGGICVVSDPNNVLGLRLNDALAGRRNLLVSQEIPGQEEDEDVDWD